MEDLTVGQLVRPRMHGGDRRLVLLFGATREVVNYSESHADRPLEGILMGDVKPASLFRQGATVWVPSATTAMPSPAAVDLGDWGQSTQRAPTLTQRSASVLLRSEGEG